MAKPTGLPGHLASAALGKERQAAAAPPDRGGYVASWLPDGRLPWLEPPEPEA